MLAHTLGDWYKDPFGFSLELRFGHGNRIDYSSGAFLALFRIMDRRWQVVVLVIPGTDAYIPSPSAGFSISVLIPEGRVAWSLWS